MVARVKETSDPRRTGNKFDGPPTAILLAHDPIQSLDRSYPYVSVEIWQSVSDNLRFPSQLVLSTFSAPWVERLVLCG